MGTPRGLLHGKPGDRRGGMAAASVAAAAAAAAVAAAPQSWASWAVARPARLASALAVVALLLFAAAIHSATPGPAASGGGGAYSDAAEQRAQRITDRLSAPMSADGPTCPVSYERHSWRQIADGAVVPWLFDGAYRNSEAGPGGRPCVNCKRGSLWPTWCGRRKTGIVNGWDLAQCSPDQITRIIDEVGRHKDVREALRMTPCDLFQHLRGRTLWIIGDSQSKAISRAVRCFLIELWPDLLEYTITNNYTAMTSLGRLPHSSTERGGPSCAHLAHGARVCTITAVKGHLLVNASRTSVPVLPLLHKHLALKEDIFLINNGLWHSDSDKEGYRQHLEELGHYYAATKKWFPNMFFMETPKQHFETPTGDFKAWWLREQGKALSNFTCQAIPNVTYLPDGTLEAVPGDEAAEEVVSGTWRNRAVREVLRDRFGMRLVATYNASVHFWNVHSHNVFGLECSHFCYPGVQHVWLYPLHKTLKAAGITRPPPQYVAPPGAQLAPEQLPEARQRRGCAEVYEALGQERLGRPKAVADVLREEDAERLTQLKERHGVLWRLWWWRQQQA